MKPYQLTLDDASRFALKNTRRADHLTSIHAARVAHRSAQTNRARALQIHAQNPQGLTDFELSELCGIQQTSIGKRRGELVAAGMIEKTELTRPSPTGSASIVWKITAKGLERARTD